jgi:hypothetical protein
MNGINADKFQPGLDIDVIGVYPIHRRLQKVFDGFWNWDERR